jgi:hypothetical protein
VNRDEQSCTNREPLLSLMFQAPPLPSSSSLSLHWCMQWFVPWSGTLQEQWTYWHHTGTGIQVVGVADMPYELGGTKKEK